MVRIVVVSFVLFVAVFIIYTIIPTYDEGNEVDLITGTEIRASYLLHPQLKLLDIKVLVNEDTVTLEGVVENEQDLKEAERLSYAVPTVKRVINHLRIKQETSNAGASNRGEVEQRGAGHDSGRNSNLGPTNLGDSEIAAQAKRILNENSQTRSEDISVEVKDRVIIISGTVPSGLDRLNAEAVLIGIPGSEKIVNNLEVTDSSGVSNQ